MIIPHATPLAPRQKIFFHFFSFSDCARMCIGAIISVQPKKGETKPMRKSCPMYAVDKVKTSVLLPAKVQIKIKNRAKEKNETPSSYISIMLFAATQKDPWTEADEAERQRIINENMKKRKILRARRKITVKGDKV